MLLMLVCGALLAVAIAVAWRWRTYRLRLPAWANAEDPSPMLVARGLAWLLGVALLSGLVMGVLVIGPTGRLAMRLLAAASPAAQGRITEAREVVGDIDLDGTIGLFIFVGLPFGLAVGLAYALTSFVLPSGLIGGAVFGAALLVVFGSTIDPLRSDNPDFDLLEPGWLSVVTFGSMALLTGILAGPIVGRVGAALGTPRAWWLAWVLPVGLLATAALAADPVALIIVLTGCALFSGALSVPPERRERVWRRGRRILQGALAVVVAVSAPGFVSSIATILE